ncbi:MAG: hypothetical protein QM632_01585 [Micrococcaceae bacterium]
MKKLLMTMLGAAAAYVAVDANKQDLTGQKKGYNAALTNATDKVRAFATDFKKGMDQKNAQLDKDRY